jgi:hypothetical protein
MRLPCVLTKYARWPPHGFAAVRARSWAGDRLKVEIPDNSCAFRHNHDGAWLHPEAFIIVWNQPGGFGSRSPAMPIGHPEHEGSQPGIRCPWRDERRGRVVMTLGRGRWARRSTSLLGGQPDDASHEGQPFLQPHAMILSRPSRLRQAQIPPRALMPLTDRHNSSSGGIHPGGVGVICVLILATPSAPEPRSLLRCCGSVGRDAPCLDVDTAIGAYRLEHSAVVGDQQQGARVGIER